MVIKYDDSLFSLHELIPRVGLLNENIFIINISHILPRFN